MFQGSSTSFLFLFFFFLRNIRGGAGTLTREDRRQMEEEESQKEGADATGRGAKGGTEGERANCDRTCESAKMNPDHARFPPCFVRTLPATALVLSRLR